ncbi:hypothetical protein, partial [Micromonospora cremea]
LLREATRGVDQRSRVDVDQLPSDGDIERPSEIGVQPPDATDRQDREPIPVEGGQMGRRQLVESMTSQHRLNVVHNPTLDNDH